MTNPRKPLRLNLGFLVSSPIGVSRDFDFDFESFKAGDDLPLSGFAGSARVSRTPQGLFIQAHFEGSTPLECARCLGTYEHALRWEFSELYAFKPENATESGLLMPEDMQIDLQPLVREYALLEVPINPLCSPACRGLCPVCGENLNQVDCGHRPSSDESPFSALKDMFN